jgi:hypothetical protein
MIKLKNFNGNRPTDLAEKNGHKEVLKILIDAISDIYENTDIKKNNEITEVLSESVKVVKKDGEKQKNVKIKSNKIYGNLIEKSGFLNDISGNENSDNIESQNNSMKRNFTVFNKNVTASTATTTVNNIKNNDILNNKNKKDKTKKVIIVNKQKIMDQDSTNATQSGKDEIPEESIILKTENDSRRSNRSLNNENSSFNSSCTKSKESVESRNGEKMKIDKEKEVQNGDENENGNENENENGSPEETYLDDISFCDSADSEEYGFALAPQSSQTLGYYGVQRREEDGVGDGDNGVEEISVEVEKEVALKGDLSVECSASGLRIEEGKRSGRNGGIGGSEEEDEKEDGKKDEKRQEKKEGERKDIESSRSTSWFSLCDPQGECLGEGVGGREGVKVTVGAGVEYYYE